jgi:CubicO group peptidase (beta-lactamase class C family)
MHGLPALAVAAGGYAKALCSGVFVQGGEVEQAGRDATFVASQADRAAFTIEVDRTARSVTVRAHGGVERVARYYGDQGCVALPPGATAVSFEPVALRVAPRDVRAPWPEGDAVEASAPPADIDAAALARSVALAFSDPAAQTEALLVVHGGRLVAERYAPGIDAATLLDASAFGKSLLATLVGVLVQAGALSVEDPAPIAAWRREGDPRASIRIIDLMRMSSGLRCTFPSRSTPTDTDSQYVYSAGADAVAFATSRPPEAPPGTRWRYQNCDPMAVAGIVRAAVERSGNSLLTYPRTALYDRLGMGRVVVEPDPYGNPLFIGNVYAPARAWARLGLLYLRDGLWEGRRLLPQGWTTLVSTPAPAAAEPVYGALFWLDRDRKPTDTYAMFGWGGQATWIIPSLDLVIVRMGHAAGGDAADKGVDEVVAGIVAAVRR